MSTTDTIRSSVSHHDDLIRLIGALDYAPKALQSQQEYIRGLNTQLEVVTKNIQELEKTTKKEKKEHKEVSESKIRKFAYRVGGQGNKYDQRVEKEHREFVEALEKEMRAKEEAELFKKILDEGNEVLRNLTAEASRHSELKAQLDHLYKSIFDGPTSEFPLDDQLERAVHQAQQRYDQIQLCLNSESQVVDLLSRAYDLSARAQQEMQQALSYSTWDMWGGGVGADMMERNAVSTATSYAGQADMLVHQAIIHANSPDDVQPIPGLQIPQISSTMDIFFDNIITDMNAHHKIEMATNQLQEARQFLTHQLSSSRSRADVIGNDLLQASNALSHARGELDGYRRRLFDQVAHSGNSGDGGGANGTAPPIPSQYAPPPYPPPQFTGGVELAGGEAAQDSQPGAQERPEMPMAPVPSWGSRNPYAAQMASGREGKDSL